MRLVISLLTAAFFIAAAEASATGFATPQPQAAPSAPKLSTIENHQAAVATSPEACRQLHDDVSVDRPSAVLQYSLLLT
jgi:hypothetical protein